jgi:hypothetical protein
MHVSSVSLSSDVLLQVLHLDILKVDQVLHMLRCDSPATPDGEGARGRTVHGVQARPSVRRSRHKQSIADSSCLA